MSFLQEGKYFIFHDIRLPWKKEFSYQIDTLISQHYALILEIKNIAGTLFFDRPINQLIRIINEKEEGFPDPILQAKRHKLQLSKWLEENGFKRLPVEYLIIISNPSTIIKNASTTPYVNKISHSADLINKISDFEKVYRPILLQPKEIKKLNKLLLRADSTEGSDILPLYSLVPSDLLTGAQCRYCSHLPLIRSHGTWICTKCNIKDKEAHLQGLEDFMLLFQKKLSSSDLCRFLHLSSRHTALRIIKSLKISK
ncbi:nuclease-related domain-containing protein [Peribacillus deserti]|uniref:nuclease-related domain-containing protein n=1 Tax=Peribacillus deserti TaxID=673318 RepID=UPI0015E0C810|nr:nuclease-related domain-containing protein [Peribacillus deserti]